MKALGFGINLQPNAARELIELGLGETLADTAIETAKLGYYNKLGQLIWSELRGRAAGYAWPQYAIERGDLQMILLDAVKARIGAHRIYRPSPLVVRAGQCRRNRTFHRTDKRSASSVRAQRCVGWLRWDSFDGSGTALMRERAPQSTAVGSNGAARSKQNHSWMAAPTPPWALGIDAPLSTR